MSQCSQYSSSSVDQGPHRDQKPWEGQLIQSRDLQFYNRQIASLLRPHLGKRILEFGMGIGNVAQFLMKDMETYIGVDAVAEHVSIALRRFNMSGFEAYVADVRQPECFGFLSQKEFDSIVSVSVLEHIEDDISALVALNRISKIGTSFAFLVPAHPCLFGYLDKQGGHFRRYSKNDFYEKLAKAGFSVEGMRRCNLPGAIAWYLAGKVPRHSANLPSCQEMTPRWNILYLMARLFRKQLGLWFSIENYIPFPWGLVLIAWGKKNKDV